MNEINISREQIIISQRQEENPQKTNWHYSALKKFLLEKNLSERY